MRLKKLLTVAGKKNFNSSNSPLYHFVFKELEERIRSLLFRLHIKRRDNLRKTANYTGKNKNKKTNCLETKLDISSPTSSSADSENSLKKKLSNKQVSTSIAPAYQSSSFKVKIYYS